LGVRVVGEDEAQGDVDEGNHDAQFDAERDAVIRKPVADGSQGPHSRYQEGVRDRRVGPRGADELLLPKPARDEHRADVEEGRAGQSSRQRRAVFGVGDQLGVAADGLHGAGKEGRRAASDGQ